MEKKTFYCPICNISMEKETYADMSDEDEDNPFKKEYYFNCDFCGNGFITKGSVLDAFRYQNIKFLEALNDVVKNTENDVKEEDIADMEKLIEKEKRRLGL